MSEESFEELSDGTNDLVKAFLKNHKPQFSKKENEKVTKPIRIERQENQSNGYHQGQHNGHSFQNHHQKPQYEKGEVIEISICGICGENTHKKSQCAVFKTVACDDAKRGGKPCMFECNPILCGFCHVQSRETLRAPFHQRTPTCFKLRRHNDHTFGYLGCGKKGVYYNQCCEGQKNQTEHPIPKRVITFGEFDNNSICNPSPRTAAEWNHASCKDIESDITPPASPRLIAPNDIIEENDVSPDAISNPTLEFPLTENFNRYKALQVYNGLKDLAQLSATCAESVQRNDPSFAFHIENVIDCFKHVLMMIQNN
jgi:hypothetical protein